MYNSLLTKLKETEDVSFSEIVSKISACKFDKQVIDYASSVTDYIEFFDKYRTTTATTALPFPIIVVLNKLKQMPSSRTSRYL